MTRRKKFVFALATGSITIALAFVAGEITVRLTTPVRYMHPRYKYLPEYGFGLYPGTRVVHGQPGRFKFHYTVNDNSHRGPVVPVRPTYEKPNIVVLGDSYTFGQGVNDGQEYASVMRDSLDGAFEVINLGSPGWGLTQEIRRFYEFGRDYRPRYVILQFCNNDPTDNLQNTVTNIKDGEFEFVPSTSSVDKFKRYLSRSIIQKSQLYNLYKGRVFEHFQNQQVGATEGELADTENEAAPSPRDRFYCELLEKFAEELRRDQITLVMTAVESQLRTVPQIQATVASLQNRGLLTYLDLDERFRGVGRGDNFYSPEGHWGWRAHLIIGTALADMIERLEAGGSH